MSCSSAPSSVSRSHVLADAELLGDAHGQLDDVLRCGGRCTRRRPRAGRTAAAPCRGRRGRARASGRCAASRSRANTRQQRDERQDEQRGARARRRRRARRAGRSGSAAASSRQASAISASIDPRGTIRVSQRARGLAQRVGGELRRERGGVGGPERPVGQLRAERDEHDRRARARTRASLTASSSRCGERSPRSTRRRVAERRRRATTSSGTSGVGSSSSIGTNDQLRRHDVARRRR